MVDRRFDGRSTEEIRPITFELGVQSGVDGSALIRWGGTHVICSASFEQKVPAHRFESGGGWLTAEYAMLPGAGDSRIRRERQGVGGRTAEIQRLIGRSLRATFDLSSFGQRTLRIDCDVLNADGGTRCASITGSYVAACIALSGLVHGQDASSSFVLPDPVAAVSVGIVDGRVVTDLCYQEDSGADVDLNFVASSSGIIEVQGTAEGAPFSREQLNQMVDYASSACEVLFGLQREALSAAEVIS